MPKALGLLQPLNLDVWQGVCGVGLSMESAYGFVSSTTFCDPIFFSQDVGTICTTILMCSSPPTEVKNFFA